jgi:hypothetical protein
MLLLKVLLISCDLLVQLLLMLVDVHVVQGRGLLLHLLQHLGGDWRSLSLGLWLV